MGVPHEWRGFEAEEVSAIKGGEQEGGNGEESTIIIARLQVTHVVCSRLTKQPLISVEQTIKKVIDVSC